MSNRNEHAYNPPEGQEQSALILWAKAQRRILPTLDLLYHVPNEGMRGVVGGVKMQHQGLKKGVPDLCLPVPSGHYHGMYIEMKRRSGSTPTEEQVWWMEALSRQGYCVCWCRGCEEAKKAILDYLKTGEIGYSPTRGRGGEYHAMEAESYGR